MHTNQKCPKLFVPFVINYEMTDAWDKCLGLVHWEDSEGLGREGGGRGDQDGEHM